MKKATDILEKNDNVLQKFNKRADSCALLSTDGNMKHAFPRMCRSGPFPSADDSETANRGLQTNNGWMDG